MKHRRPTEPVQPHLFGGHLMDFAISLAFGMAIGAAVMLGLRAAMLR